MAPNQIPKPSKPLFSNEPHIIGSKQSSRAPKEPFSYGAPKINSLKKIPPGRNNRPNYALGFSRCQFCSLCPFLLRHLRSFFCGQALRDCIGQGSLYGFIPSAFHVKSPDVVEIEFYALFDYTCKGSRTPIETGAKCGKLYREELVIITADTVLILKQSWNDLPWSQIS
ncbi:methylaspartate mutase S chain [Striga asiatica]|uniref:Methylaspartate mutase S chain n=1 Tax=Striga asiatica TaxID=4170 RepID=A0A5A7QW57_STRAF|nr:methylaspartate mutase S chain [Striga asiatica]